MWKKGGNQWGMDPWMVMNMMQMMGGKGGKGHYGKGSKGKKKAIKPKDESGGVLGEFTGKLTKVGYKYGFVESDDLKATQGYDEIFVLWDEIQNVKKGQKVRFTCFLDGEGRVQAKSVKPTS
mmetsp:Transcript_69146/g.123106  ORF Transcript_69146/g.123106 Transcript_69146/m.123106 type:complete len:122 (-) Transcript_69146:84-449(-)